MRIGGGALPSPSNVKESRSFSTTSRNTPLAGKSWPLNGGTFGPFMTIRSKPPGRRSISQTGAVKSFGGNHWAICFGSVHALYTSSRGALNTRVVVKVRSAGAATELLLSLTAILPLVLSLQLLQIALQAIEALLPETPVALHPVVDVLERTRVEPAGPPLGLATARDQPGVLEDLKVFRDGRKGHVERLGDLGHRGLTFREAREDGAPRRIGERGECRAE